jgi:hypothetical protein
LPLSVVSVLAVGPGLRGTATVAPAPFDWPAFPAPPPAALRAPVLGGRAVGAGAGPDGERVPPYVPAHEALILLESSNAWPDTAAAVAHTLAAWHLRLGDALKAAAAASGGAVLVAPTPSWLDVVWGGHAFRLRVWHDQLTAVLAPSRAPAASAKAGAGPRRDPHADNADAEDGEEKSGGAVDARAMACAMQLAPVHASMVHGLSMRFPAYALSVRLCARWVHAHLFSAVLAHEAIELLVASLFDRPGAYAAPTSALAAFARFLHLVATHAWAEAALVVDLDGTLAPADRQALAHAAQRSRPGTATMLLPCAYDKNGVAWTRTQPSAVLLARLGAYARAAVETLHARALHADFSLLVHGGHQ